MSINVKMQRNSDKIFKISDEKKKVLQDRWKNAEAHKAVKREIKMTVRYTSVEAYSQNAVAVESQPVVDKKPNVSILTLDNSLTDLVHKDVSKVKDCSTTSVLDKTPSNVVLDDVNVSKVAVSNATTSVWSSVWKWVFRIKLFFPIMMIAYRMFMMLDNTQVEEIFSFFGERVNDLHDLLHYVGIFGYETPPVFEEKIVEEKVEDTDFTIVAGVLGTYVSFGLTVLFSIA